MSILTGAIVIWSGSASLLPQGWQLCDGTNGTPDLRNKFIIGAGDLYSIGNTGGFTDSILPAHTHSVVLSSSGGHTHFLRMSNFSSGNFQDGVHGNNRDRSQLNISLLAAGAHTHSGGTLNATGVTTSLSGRNIPPYYSLAYIIQMPQ